MFKDCQTIWTEGAWIKHSHWQYHNFLKYTICKQPLILILAFHSNIHFKQKTESKIVLLPQVHFEKPTLAFPKPTWYGLSILKLTHWKSLN